MDGQSNTAASNTVTQSVDPDNGGLFNTDDLAWTLNTMSLRQNSAQIASLDDTISGLPATLTSHPVTATSGSGVRSAASAPTDPHTSSLNHAVPSSAASSPPITIPPTIPSASFNTGVTVSSRPARVRTGTLDNTNTLSPTPDVNMQDESRAASAEALRHEGPMTPRNAAGPFVLDGVGRRDEVRERDRNEGEGEVDVTMIG